MCFLLKLQMGYTLLLAVIPALAFATTSLPTNISGVNSSDGVTMKRPATPCTIVTATVCQTNHILPVRTRLKVKWDKNNPCHGEVQLLINFTKHPKPLCLKSLTDMQDLGTEMCEERRCGNFLGFRPDLKVMGYVIEENVTVMSCSRMLINCKDNNELVPYKVVVGLLVVLILIVFFLRVGLPSYKAIRKRLSQKRQSRWIGPTQSQSVSYHRNQAGAKNNTAKRQSYPGLERLSVNPSREPSSNRNSDYDSYGCN